MDWHDQRQAAIGDTGSLRVRVDPKLHHGLMGTRPFENEEEDTWHLHRPRVCRKVMLLRLLATAKFRTPDKTRGWNLSAS